MVDIQQLGPERYSAGGTHNSSPSAAQMIARRCSPAGSRRALCDLRCANRSPPMIVPSACMPAARALVRSLVVPRILAGTDRDVVQLVLTQPEFSRIRTAASCRGGADP